MTAQQAKTIRDINDQHATQRFIAAQASRGAARAQLLANTLERAGELAMAGRLAESKRVIELNFFSAEEN